ncbi:MAG: transcription initiation protein [Gloeobacteraceae cyanobacterium ES-bin-316]|nr:transcription initiation protein [Ferruginibacter sp.]
MEEFMMIFRMAPMGDFQPTPEQMQEGIKHWQDWIGGIAAQGKFVSTNQLGFTGKTLKADGIITDGPYAEVKEIVGGYIIVKANGMDDAMDLAKGCPILFIGGHVEVRAIMQLNP